MDQLSTTVENQVSINSRSLEDDQVVQPIADLSQLSLGYYDQIVAQRAVYELDQETGESTGMIEAYDLIIESEEGQLARRYDIRVPIVLV